MLTAALFLSYPHVLRTYLQLQPPHIINHSIHKYASCSKECFILALIYIDRLIQRNNFLLTELNVHRVVITAILLAAKFFDDAYYNNAYYAKVGGVHVAEMNNLETQFLFKIDFSLRVLPQVFDKYAAELISHSSSQGLELIEHCTNEELLLRVPSVAEIKMASGCGGVNAVAAVQSPAHVVNPVLMFSDSISTPAVAPQQCTTTAAANPWPLCPMEAVQHIPTSQLAQHVQQVNRQQQQQHQAIASSALDPLIFSFPTLAPQVSVNHVAQPAPPARNTSALDLYHNEVLPGQYGFSRTVTASAAPTPQGQVYTQPQQPSEFDHLRDLANSIYQNDYSNSFATAAAPMDGIAASISQYPIQQVANANSATAPQAQAPPVYSQNTNYFNTTNGGVVAQSNIQQKYPEITPSPPPQHPVNIVGAPYHEFLGTPYHEHQQHQYNHSHYPMPTTDAAASGMAGFAVSRPIAIGGLSTSPHLSTSWNSRGGGFP